MKDVKSIEKRDIVEVQAATCENLLHRHGIDTSSWGSGSTKTLTQLATELLAGECALDMVELKTGEMSLVRRFSVVEANVYYATDDGTVLRLREVTQNFNDGRSRARPHVTTSIAEKMRINEDPDAAILRGLSEELGIVAAKWQIELIGGYRKEGTSQSYPGLLSIMRLHQFDAYLTDEQYSPDGYVERQADKTTYFSWVECCERADSQTDLNIGTATK